MKDDDGKPVVVGEEITRKVDTGGAVHADLVAALAREVHRLGARVARAENLAIQAIRRANAATARDPKP